MTAAMTDTPETEPGVDTLDTKRRLLLWTVRFVMPVFIIATLVHPDGLQLIDRAALAICPLTWLMLERSVRGQNLFG